MSSKMIGDGLHRRDIPSKQSIVNPCEESTSHKSLGQYIDHEYTIMEEILLLGLKDKEGYISFWNDCISGALRGAIIAELALRGKLDLEKGVRLKRLCKRKLIVIADDLTEEPLLDEALKIIKQSQQTESVHDWISYLNGDSWNPMKLNYQIKNVRMRIAKSLAEKGVLSTQKKNFILFNMITHPLTNTTVKEDLISKIQHALLGGWVNDWQRMDSHIFTLIIVAYASDVLENAFEFLNDEDYEIAKRRSSQLADMHFEHESQKPNSNPVLLAVFDALIN